MNNPNSHIEARCRRKDDMVEITRFHQPLPPLFHDLPSPSGAAGVVQVADEVKVRVILDGLFADDDFSKIMSFARFRVWFTAARALPIDELIKARAIPRFIKLLGRDDMPELQSHAAWLLAVVASGTSVHRANILKYGVVRILVELLSSPFEEVREQAALVLGYIAGDSALYRNIVVLAHDALMPLLAQLDHNSSLSTLKTLTWALSNFFSGKPPVSLKLVRPALLILRQLICLNAEDVLVNVCWSIFYISDGTNNGLQAVIESGVCNRLSDLLLHPSPRLLGPVLLTLGNIAGGDDSQRQVLIDNQVLPRLQNIVAQRHTKSIEEEACWIISNITVGNEAHACYIPSYGFMSLVTFKLLVTLRMC